MDNYKLTIGIPTYNRVDKVVSLLNFINTEIGNLQEKGLIEVIVFDNCSTDDTEKELKYLQKSLAESLPFVYYRNESNIGLVNNVLKICNHANGEYVWIMGDDDIYHKGIVERVFNETTSNDYSMIFINHCLYEKQIGDRLYVPSMLDGIDVDRTDQNVLLDITHLHGTCLMYISSIVHKTSCMKEIQKETWEINLAYPLLMSFYSASCGKVKLIPEVLIDDVCGVTSWDDKSTMVFGAYVPYCLRQLVKLNYNRKGVDALYKSYMKKRGYPYSALGFLSWSIKHPRGFIMAFFKRHYVLNNIISLFN